MWDGRLSVCGVERVDGCDGFSIPFFPPLAVAAFSMFARIWLFFFPFVPLLTLLRTDATLMPHHDPPPSLPSLAAGHAYRYSRAVSSAPHSR